VGIGCAAVEALVSALHAGSTQPKTCRSCGHDHLDAVLDLGRLPLANALLTAEQLALPEDRFPLELYFCPRCALVQIGESVPPQRLFRDYAYASSYSDTMVEHARVLVEALIDARRLGRESLVIEVASNDGYLLQSYRRHDIPVLGIEPAANIAELATRKGIPTLVEFFDEELARRLAAQERFADVIHAHNVLAHVPDPNRFVGGIKQVLKPDGIAIVEVPYVRDLIAKVECSRGALRPARAGDPRRRAHPYPWRLAAAHAGACRRRAIGAGG
jgi:SAM-dependent methyltransferase